MCHPALASEERETFAHLRYKEYEYLSSDEYLRDLDEFSINLGRIPGFSA